MRMIFLFVAVMSMNSFASVVDMARESLGPLPTCTPVMQSTIQRSSDLFNANICEPVRACRRNISNYFNSARSPFTCAQGTLGDGVGALNFGRQAASDFTVEVVADLAMSYDGGSNIYFTFFQDAIHQRGIDVKIANWGSIIAGVQGRFGIIDGQWVDDSLTNPRFSVGSLTLSDSSVLHKDARIVLFVSRAQRTISLNINGTKLGSFVIPSEYMTDANSNNWEFIVGNYQTPIHSIRYLQ